MIKAFIVGRGGTTLLEKIAHAPNISDRDRTAFVNFLADYIVTIFGIQPSTSEMVKFAVPAVDLVPALVNPVSHLK